MLTVPYTQFTLPNGLHVILHQDKTVPVASVNVWYHVGSGREKPGRTGFAHLFEHVMFEGSEHVPEGNFDALLEANGGDNNGSTSEDRTNYVIDVPSNALELALFLESDRMGFLLPTLTQAKLDGQRDVVKNEKRQRVDNAPYGQAFVELSALLYPATHPYSWPVIGSMEDLSAASLQDVVEFFKTYYAPNNASLVVAGDIEFEPTAQTRRKMVRRNPARGRRAAARAGAGLALRGEAQDHQRQGAVAASLHGLAHAGPLCARRRGDGHGLEPADGGQELAVVSPARLRDAGGPGRRRRRRCRGPSPAPSWSW